MSSNSGTIQMREIIGARKVAKKKKIITFGAKLGERLRSEGMEVSDFITKSGMKQPNVYRWLEGKGISPANAVAVADFFGDDPSSWMIAAGYPGGGRKDLTQDDQEWINLRQDFPWLGEFAPEIATLSPEDREIVRNLVRNLGRRGRDKAP